MKNLKNNLVFLILVLFLNACQSTKNFEMKSDEKAELNIVEISTNRIIQECYFINAEKENNWRHQYILNMLNERNEVIPVFYPTNQGKTECLSHLKKVEKILKKESQVKLCVRGQLEKIASGNFPPEFYDFGPLGKHESPYYSLTFDTICNSKDCYSINETRTTTCPGFEKHFSKE